jgi:subtilisin family serine protease
VKVLNARMIGSTSALVEGLYFAAEKGARVINLSLAYAPSAILDRFSTRRSRK